MFTKTRHYDNGSMTQHVSTVLSANGRIVAATNRITLAHAAYIFAYFIMVWETGRCPTNFCPIYCQLFSANNNNFTEGFKGEGDAIGHVRPFTLVVDLDILRVYASRP